MAEKKSEDVDLNQNDSGQKWVFLAIVLGSIVIALLVASNMIMQQQENFEINETQNNQEAPVVDENELPNVTEENVAPKNYDYDLTLAPQNCDGVEGDVDIVLITDANYMDFTRVAINSAKETKCPLSRYHFYVMSVELPQSDVNALTALASDDVTVEVLPQQQPDLFYIRDTHVSKASLLKYYIPTALENKDKVLYIDSDVLVLHDLNALYNTDISSVYLAAVKDPSWFFENVHVLELNLESRGFYFNTGVLLMNLKKMRDDNLIAGLEDFTNNNFRTYMDQDAFNVVVGDSVVLLPFADNTMNFFFEHVDLPTMKNFYAENWNSLEDVFANATIIHFASSKKPLGTNVSNDEMFRLLQRLWYKYYTPLPALD